MTILLIPALALYPFAATSKRVANLAHLIWTCAYLAVLVHGYWAVFVIFDGVADTFRQMGFPIAAVNFLLLMWWGLDVLLLWTLPRESRALRHFQWSARVFTFLMFSLTWIVLRGGPARILCIVFAASIVTAVAVRLWARERPNTAPTTTI
jgi:hypothetical protein